MTSDLPSEAEHFLVCLSGPDQGKRIALRTDEAMLGRSLDCNLLSDDPEVATCHVALAVASGRPVFRTVGGAAVYVDGHRAAEGSLSPRQQIRIGRSMWQLVTDQAGGGLSGWLDNLGGHISFVAGVERVRGFSVREMFSEVFRKRDDEDLEEYFLVGAPSTTPSLTEVDTRWPKPWVFAQIFGLSLIVYLGFVFALQQFLNVRLVPGVIITGSFLVPFSLLIFFFEVNVARNVSLYQVIKLVFTGGILSLILSLFLFEQTRLSSWLGAMSAGLVEESGKAATLLLVVNKLRYRWTLNGLVFGAAVGTGFASFESAGYALEWGMKSSNQGIALEPLLDIIKNRGLLSVLGGHVLWTGLVGAALWRVRGDQEFSFAMVKDPRFLRVFGLAVGIHMIWNSPLLGEHFYFKAIPLGFVAWMAILGFVQDGLKQLRLAKQEATQPVAT